MLAWLQSLKGLHDNKSKLRASKFLSDFKTVVVDAHAFKSDVDNGRIILRLLNRTLEVELRPIEVQAKDAVILQ